MNFCEDCRHCVVEDGEYRFARCDRAKLANGDGFISRALQKEDRGFCSVQRTVGECGPEGKLFEPAPSPVREAA